MKKYMRNNIIKATYSFLWAPIIVVPVVLAFLYNFILAEDEYEVEAAAIVKENESSRGPSIPGVAGALFDYGNNTSVEDAYILQEFLRGKAFFTILSEAFDLHEHYGNNGFFLFQKMSPPEGEADIYSYMKDRVRVSVSTETSMLTLNVRSFDAAYSNELISFILDVAERRINDLSGKIAESRMQLAESEFRKAESLLREAELKLLDFQVNNGWLGSEVEVSTLFARVNQLRDSKTSKSVELATMKRSFQPDAVAVRVLEEEIEVLGEQLKGLESGLLGEENQSFLSLSSDYNILRLDSELERTKYTAALAALQQARLEASQQQKFLLVVSPPVSLDDPIYPQPLRSILTIAVVAFLIFLLIKLIVSVILDHTI